MDLEHSMAQKKYAKDTVKLRIMLIPRFKASIQVLDTGAIKKDKFY